MSTRSLIRLASAVLFVGLTLAGLATIQVFSGGAVPEIDLRLFDFKALLAIFSLLVFYFASDGLRLYFILRTVGERVSLRDITPLVFINFFFSNITPMATGGGFAQVLYLQRIGVSIGSAAAATSIRTILAMLVIFTAAPTFQLLFAGERSPNHFSDKITQSLSVVIALYLIGFLIILFQPTRVAALIKLALRGLSWLGLIGDERRERWSALVGDATTGFSNGFRVFLTGQRIYFALSILFSVFFLLALFSFPALLMALLDYDVDWLAVIGTLSVVTFLMYFAPSPGGAGFSELAFAGLMAGQIAPEHLVLIVLAWRVLTTYLGVAIGALVTLNAVKTEVLRK